MFNTAGFGIAFAVLWRGCRGLGPRGSLSNLSNALDLRVFGNRAVIGRLVSNGREQQQMWLTVIVHLRETVPKIFI